MRKPQQHSAEEILRKIFIITLFLFTGSALAQQPAASLHYGIESGAVAGNKYGSPFWLRSNTFGLITYDQYNFWLRGYMNGQYEGKHMTLFYGMDLVDRYAEKNKFLIHQGYAGLKAGPVVFKAGIFEEVFGNQDSSLSSGGIIWSGNSSPVPQITIGIPDYTPVPFTGGYVEIKGGISHGWLGNDIIVDNILLHHKYAYIRFGGDLPVRLHYGLQHFAEWGGHSSNPKYGDLPDDFSDFLRVFMSRGGSEGAYWTEYKNATGNHLGSHNLGLDIKLKKHEIDLYWQTIFEDGSGLRLRNIRDGLWGLKLSFRSFDYVSGVLAEYINTTDQSGTYDVYYENDTMKFAGGNDNYFNNGVYEGGWTYHGKTIGTPLITSPEVMCATRYPYLLNNKITALHFGIEGKINSFYYKALYSFSKNYGTNAVPFPKEKNQHSVLLKGSLSDRLPWNLSVSAALAFDIGDLYDDNLGIMFSIRKEGFIRLPETLK